MLESLALFALYLALSPLLVGVVNRVKSFLAGRRGPPLWQLYADLGRLVRKGAVYSQTASWVFRAAPVKAQVSLYVPTSVCVVLLTSTLPTVAPVSLLTPAIVYVAVCAVPS